MQHTIETNFFSMIAAKKEIAALGIPCKYHLTGGIDRRVKISFSCEGAILRDIVTMLDQNGMLD